ncbi:MAG: Crp/Fnr family transcriptional regulator [Clostridia bacterium]|nr:Crp/Fnr family transcriptional regulator [Clostridia bacterium]NCC44835.1 Crp/Fnr family transcriptional regulator [Clostridia bacterium]
MEKFVQTPIFMGIKPEELDVMLKCLGTYKRKYKKGTRIFQQGDKLQELGLVLTGKVHIVKLDVWGKESILGESGPGQVFGETYACRSDEPLMVDVAAVEDTEILFLSVKRILTTCSSSCQFHNRLINNLVYVMAGKNLNLSRKIDCITPRSIRERILSYLSYEAIKQGSCIVDISFSRQQLADYLAVDRSALSSELSKMQKDGLLEYNKNHFEIHKDI